MTLDPEQVESCLRALIKSLDYQLHQDLQIDAVDGRDWYPDIADEFIEMYENFGK